jgi:phosphoadenosine phosphosulfate reductase
LKLSELESKLSELSAGDGLALISELYPAEVVFSTSLGQEDQVITHFIAQRSLPITIFSLDTGRLFAETLDLLARTESKYNLRFKLYYPQTDAVQNLVADQGINGFYDAVQNRKSCCSVRKVEPHKRALASKKFGSQAYEQSKVPTAAK